MIDAKSNSTKQAPDNDPCEIGDAKERTKGAWCFEAPLDGSTEWPNYYVYQPWLP